MNKYESFYKSVIKSNKAKDDKKHENEMLRQMHEAKLPEPHREFAFRSDRKWRFDFCFPDNKLAVEVEGGLWSGGRHVRAFGFESDCAKYNEAALDGWLVLRITPGMIRDLRAINFIQRALANVPSG